MMQHLSKAGPCSLPQASVWRRRGLAREGGNYKRNNHHRIWLEGHFQNGRDRGRQRGGRWVEHRAVKRFGFAHNSSSSNFHAPLFSSALITRAETSACSKMQNILPCFLSKLDLGSEFCFDLSCRAYVLLLRRPRLSLEWQ